MIFQVASAVLSSSTVIPIDCSSILSRLSSVSYSTLFMHQNILSARPAPTHFRPMNCQNKKVFLYLTFFNYYFFFWFYIIMPLYICGVCEYEWDDEQTGEKVNTRRRPSRTNILSLLPVCWWDSFFFWESSWITAHTQRRRLYILLFLVPPILLLLLLCLTNKNK